MMPPVGKSGAEMWLSINSSMVMSGLSMVAMMPLTTSVRLWGIILVAIPTAIPVAPLINKLGIRVGRTVGSSSESSKLGAKSTVSFSISPRMKSLMRRRRASVYRIAAGPSPSMLPKLPCGSTKV